MSEEYIIKLDKEDADLFYDIGSSIGGWPDPGHPRHVIDEIMKQLYYQGIRHDMNVTSFSRDMDGCDPTYGIYINRKDNNRQTSTRHKNENLNRTK